MNLVTSEGKGVEGGKLNKYTSWECTKIVITKVQGSKGAQILMQ